MTARFMTVGLRWLRRLLLWLVLPLLVVVLLLALAVGTRPGVQLVAQVAMSAVPQLVIEELDGNLAWGVRAARVQWQDESGVVVELQGLASVWQPACLLHAQICIDSLAAGVLRVQVPAGSPAPDDPADTAFNPLTLPLVVLPWNLKLEQLYLAQIDIVLPERTLQIGPVSLRARWSGARVTVEELQAAMKDPFLGQADARLSGILDMEAEWPLQLSLGGTYTPPLPDWQEQHVQLAGRGNLRHLQLDGTLNAGLQVLGLPPLTLAADVATASLDTRATLYKLDGEYQGAPLQMRGGLVFTREGHLTLDDILARWGDNRVQLAGELRDSWDVKGTLALAQPALLAPDARGRLDGSVALSGPGADPRVSLTARSAELGLPTVQLNNLAVDASFNPVTLNRLQASLTAATLRIDDQTLRDLELKLTGDAEQHQLSLKAQQEFRGIDTQIEGSLDRERFDWSGTVAQLQVQLERDWQLRLELPAKVRWQQQAQRLKVDQSCLADGSGRVCFSLDQQIAAQRGDTQLDLTSFDLTRLQPWLQDQVRDLHGRVDSRLRVQGAWLDPTVNGELSVTELGLRLPGESPLVLDAADVQARFKGRTASIDTRFDLPPHGRWQSESAWQLRWSTRGFQLDRGCGQWFSLPDGDKAGDLCVAGEQSSRRGLTGSVEADLVLAEALRPYLPDGFGIDGGLTARGHITLKGSAMRADLDVQAPGGKLLLSNGDDTAPVALDYRLLHWQARLERDVLDTTLMLDSSGLGQGQVQAKVGVRRADPDIDLTAHLDQFRLSVLRPLFPRLTTLDGQVSVDARMTGSLGAPLVHGEARLQDLAVQDPALPQGIDDLDARLVFSGDRAELQGQLTSGEGGADLGGQLQLADTGWQGEFTLKGRKLVVRQSQDFTLRLQPDFTLQVAPDRLHLVGTLVLPSGFVWIKELPEGSVDVSDDTVFVDEQGEPVTTPTGTPVTADILVSVRDKLRLRGFGGNVRLNGDVQVRLDQTGVATGRGTIDITEGSYTGFGQQLKIRKGQIIFNGPLDRPYINLEAVRVVENVVAGLRVSGPADEPVATLFSEPAMADSEVLYYIVTGKKPGTGTTEDNNLVQNALLSMSLSQDRLHIRSLASKMGIEDLQMGTGGVGNETEVRLSGYLSPRTYLQYGISLFQPVNTLTVRYELRSNLFLEAVSGLASALDLLYSFEF